MRKRLKRYSYDMLTSLSIHNIVLIDKLAINFQPGFCALTGETGAGKSILLDALALALGIRAESGLVRKGADKATVSASFELPEQHDVFALIDDQGLTAENPLILRRVVGSDGRSKAFINDQPVSVGLLRQIGEMLVEIHGQFETLGLLDPKTHRGILDEYAGIDPDELQTLWDAWKLAERDVESAKAAIDKARTDEDYLRQSVHDLDALDPKGGNEENELSQLREKLMSREHILEGLNIAYQALSNSESVSDAYRALDRLSAKGGDELQNIIQTLDRADAEIQEANGLIQSLSTDLSEEDQDLESIDDRLHNLRTQARKHHCNVDELPAKRDELAQQLNMIDAQDDSLSALIQAAEKAKQAFEKMASEITQKRRDAATTLDSLVGKELPPLKLEKAAFVTDIETLDEADWGPHGFDRVRFLVSTNPGREPGPLNKIASGGEMSRFMLALKVVMAETGTAQSMIFDEVDSGIGGATASAVGQRLGRLATHKQILVVTHAPQVAARADHHFIVLKESGDDDVRTSIVPLSEQPARREEIARMLAGSEITEEARAAADKLMETGT